MASLPWLQPSVVACAFALVAGCGSCPFERSVRSAINPNALGPEGLPVDAAGVPTDPRFSRFRVLEFGKEDRAADGTLLCKKLCPPSAPEDWCEVTRPKGGALVVECRD